MPYVVVWRVCGGDGAKDGVISWMERSEGYGYAWYEEFFEAEEVNINCMINPKRICLYFWNGWNSFLFGGFFPYLLLN